jgi:transposase
MGKRKRHTEEFKREAVRLMETRGNRSIADVAEGLGILTNQLYDWRHKFGDVRQAVRDERGETPEEELKRLRRDVARLTREREILVKAAAFFAKENG